MLVAGATRQFLKQQKHRQQIRGYALGSQKWMMPGPLWRGKSEVSLEAQHAVSALKAARGNPPKIAEVLKTRISRLIKLDHLSVLFELQNENEVDLAMKVFEEARKDTWYKPSVPLYRDMLNVLARNGRVEDVESMLQQMKKEDVEFEMVIYEEIVCAFIELRMYDTALHFFELMRNSEVPPNSGMYRTIMNLFKRHGQTEISEVLHKQLLAYIKARYGTETFPPCRALSVRKKEDFAPISPRKAAKAAARAAWEARDVVPTAGIYRPYRSRKSLHPDFPDGPPKPSGLM